MEFTHDIYNALKFAPNYVDSKDSFIPIDCINFTYKHIIAKRSFKSD